MATTGLESRGGPDALWLRVQLLRLPPICQCSSTDKSSCVVSRRLGVQIPPLAPYVSTSDRVRILHLDYLENIRGLGTCWGQRKCVHDPNGEGGGWMKSRRATSAD